MVGVKTLLIILIWLLGIFISYVVFIASAYRRKDYITRKDLAYFSFMTLFFWYFYLLEEFVETLADGYIDGTNVFLDFTEKKDEQD